MMAASSAERNQLSGFVYDQLLLQLFLHGERGRQLKSCSRLCNRAIKRSSQCWLMKSHPFEWWQVTTNQQPPTTNYHPASDISVFPAWAFKSPWGQHNIDRVLDKSTVSECFHWGILLCFHRQDGYIILCHMRRHSRCFILFNKLLPATTRVT